MAHPLTEKRDKITKQLKDDIQTYVHCFVDVKCGKIHHTVAERKYAQMNQTLTFLIEAAIEEGIELGKEIIKYELENDPYVAYYKRACTCPAGKGTNPGCPVHP